MKENDGLNTHNQVVPGSSPGGPTKYKRAADVMFAALFFANGWSIKPFAHNIMAHLFQDYVYVPKPGREP